MWNSSKRNDYSGRSSHTSNVATLPPSPMHECVINLHNLRLWWASSSHSHCTMADRGAKVLCPKCYSTFHGTKRSLVGEAQCGQEIRMWFALNQWERMDIGHHNSGFSHQAIVGRFSPTMLSSMTAATSLSTAMQSSLINEVAVETEIIQDRISQRAQSLCKVFGHSDCGVCNEHHAWSKMTARCDPTNSICLSPLKDMWMWTGKWVTWVQHSMLNRFRRRIRTTRAQLELSSRRICWNDVMWYH